RHDDPEPEVTPAKVDARKPVCAQGRGKYHSDYVQRHDNKGIPEVEAKRFVGQRIDVILKLDRVRNPLRRILENIGLRFQRAAHQPGKGHEHEHADEDEHYQREQTPPPDSWGGPKGLLAYQWKLRRRCRRLKYAHGLTS